MKLEIVEDRKETEPNSWNYEVLRPSGNDTAVVWTNNIRDLKDNSVLRKKIDTAIKLENPNVEQVGFLDLSNPDSPTVMMAGLEFCGNFLRCCAYLSYLKSGRKNPKVTINFILQDEELLINAGVSGLQNAWAEVPVSPDSIQNVGGIYSMVDLKGITHLVVPTTFSDISENMIDRARNFLSANSLEYLHRS